MGEKTGIGWTTGTWNPHYGCEHVSPGCDNCYMFAWAKRAGKDPETITRSSKEVFDAPLKWARKGDVRYVFTCSLSDFFITKADAWRDDAWDIIRRTPALTYQILTKRPGLIPRRVPADWGDGWHNAWLGVSVESRNYLWRLDVLRDFRRCALRFASFEPLLEDLGTINLSGFSWAIIGGESGPQRRPCEIDWIRHAADECQRQGAAVFVKQDSALWSGRQGRLPEDLWALKTIPLTLYGKSSGPHKRN